MTVTTVVLARRSKQEGQDHLFSGGILIASGVMYLRLAILLALFNPELMKLLAPAFLILAVVAIAIGWLWSRLKTHWKSVRHCYLLYSSLPC